MKIAVWHNLPSGGGKRALYYHVKGLVERGHTVESWCPSTADQTYLPLNEIIPEHIIPFLKQPKNIKTPFDRFITDYKNIAKQIKIIDEHCQQCAQEINAKNFDILLANSSSFIATSSIGRYIKIPKIIYLQEPARPLYEALPKLPWIALPPPKTTRWSKTDVGDFIRNIIKVQGLRIQLREEYINAQAFDRILVNSRYSRESVLRAYGLDSKVCYLGIDTELFQPKAVAKEKIVVGLGAILSVKKIERAIKALDTIEKSKRPELVWIANMSEKNYYEQMEKLAESLSVKLTFKVRVTDEELVNWLNRASVMIYTSQLEPFGFAPLEANACGTPVVAIAEGGIRETVQDKVNGFLIDDDNPIALGIAISQLLEDPNLVQTLGQKARQYVLENWTWDKALDRLESHLYSFLGNLEK